MSMRSGGFGLVLIIAVFWGIIIQPAGGAQFAGGKGLTFVQFPTVLNPGSLSITFHTRGFVKNTPGQTITDGTGAISFNFGFSRHLEFGFTQILYQDLNASASSSRPKILEQIPDDAYLRVKVGGYPFTIGNAYFKFGVLNQIRYRTGLVHGVYLEPYSGNGISWEIDLMTSYYVNPLYEDDAPAFHFNLGYLNHNDAGTDSSVFKASQEILAGLAFVYPTRYFDFGLQTYGHFFTKLPRKNAYSREDAIWVAPTIRYKLFYGVSLLLGLDLRVWEQEDQTEIAVSAATLAQNDWSAGQYLPDGYPLNYPTWRLNGNLIISPSTLFYKEPTFSRVSDPLSTRKLLRDRKSLFEWVVDEQQGVEYIDVELEKIKAARKKAEQELEKLKQELGQP